MNRNIPMTTVDTDALAERFRTVRRFTEELAEPLSAEDCAVQSMPDVSPTRWHLAHTTWFFDTFLLSQKSGYRAFDTMYAYLFNSYYNVVGNQFPRSQRGLITRPGLAEVMEYRRHVDAQMMNLLTSEDGQIERLAEVTEIGIQHEQQHQELILTDIKHVLSHSPLRPTYRQGTFAGGDDEVLSKWNAYDEGIYWIGHEGDDFCFDNEQPRHRAFLERFQLASQLVTCGDYLRFIEDGGYDRPELWLSLGWDTARQHEWESPLYWYRDDGQWFEFTLAGPVPIDPDRPVCHVSYFEADAFARWADARLPTESEWEIVSSDVPIEGRFADQLWTHNRAIHPCREDPDLNSVPSMFGNVWQWTASPYTPYPGYQPPRGALGEYNGKFMCNQYVLRGGSCATSSSHIRSTYRNFFPPEARWQFTGIRLCR